MNNYFGNNSNENNLNYINPYSSGEFYMSYIPMIPVIPPVFMPRQRQLTPPGPPPDQISEAEMQSQLAKSSGIKSVNQKSIRPCLFRFVYIWPKRGKGFWSWLTYVGKKSVSGYRWYRRRWVYFGMDLKEIKSFICK
ncbi:hypothetical protein [Clostridium sp. cel8]|jgi:hypothetical protein|uniref:hypothetical protein n=1 Tax=Clostridium sp. cel8 TaxID=2663123 RepID=UPI001FAC2271|nr:hypothetical protein [Clostridium sp. cel8]